MQVPSSNMQIEGVSGQQEVAEPTATSTLPETEMYAFLLVLTHAIDQKRFQQARVVAEHAVSRITTAFNRRTLDTIAAKIYYMLSLAAEALGSLDSIRRWVPLGEEPQTSPLLMEGPSLTFLFQISSLALL